MYFASVFNRKNYFRFLTGCWRTRQSVSTIWKLAPHAAGGCRRARVVHGKYVTVGYGALPAVVVLSLLATARAGI